MPNMHIKKMKAMKMNSRMMNSAGMALDPVGIATLLPPMATGALPVRQW